MEQSLSSIIVNAVNKSGAVEKSVLLLLLALSVLSWALILLKARMIRRTRRDNAGFLAVFEQADHTGAVLAEAARFPQASMLVMFSRALEVLRRERTHAELRPVVAAAEQLPLKTAANLAEKVQQSLQHAARAEAARMFRGLDTLASIGSASPFIGLLGTVWGIMGTFQALSGAKSASLQVVAPGIASALIATAAGLAVAIPAVAAYNWIMARLDELQEDENCFVERAALLLLAGGAFSGGTRPAAQEG